ncbi:hypothetical protein HMN09_00865700 [Mycena chlorophos]|uniref:F-box domain-containing protein n=1 Tax=Mycena chlorophos TaxID=658473 RepID=A0A8H6SPE4_MYCCL|nr:hypothetical protein HMN09_00865700 [Mycena chlorophos]
MATLVDIPPELIDAIVEHIPDVASLKSCSLVSPIFRFPCQKRLHHTLQLEFTGPDSQRDPRRRLEAVSRRFDESPHLSGFITRLSVQVISPWAGPDDQSAFARRVFNALGHVKKATFENGLRQTASWGSLPPDLGSAVLEWLARRGRTEPLQGLTFQYINLPEAVIPVILGAAASLALQDCALENMATLPSVQSAPSPEIRALRRFEAHSSWTIVETLCTARRGYGVSSLGRLAIQLANNNAYLGMFADLCASSAGTLKSLKLGLESTIIHPPQCAFLLQRFTTPLPHIRTVSIILNGTAPPDELRTILWVLQHAFRPAVLPSLSRITCIVYNFRSLSPESLPIAGPEGLPPTFTSDELTPFDALVVEHPTLKAFVWESNFLDLAPGNGLGDLEAEDKARYFERFCVGMKRVMPRSDEMERLVFRRGN